jgi:hypothetical protein
VDAEHGWSRSDGSDAAAISQLQRKQLPPDGALAFGKAAHWRDSLSARQERGTGVEVGREACLPGGLDAFFESWLALTPHALATLASNAPGSRQAWISSCLAFLS